MPIKLFENQAILFLSARLTSHVKRILLECFGSFGLKAGPSYLHRRSLVPTKQVCNKADHFKIGKRPATSHTASQDRSRWSLISSQLNSNDNCLIHECQPHSTM